MSGIKKVFMLLGSLVIILISIYFIIQAKTVNDSNYEDGYDIIVYEDSISDESYQNLLNERQDTLPEGYSDEHVRGDMYNPDDPYEPNYTHYTKLTPKQSEEFLANKGSGIVYFGWVECSYCYRIRQSVDFVLSDLQQDIYYVEVEDLNNAEGTLGQDILRSYNVKSTPTFLVIKDGVEVDRMSAEMQGELNYLDLLQWFRESSKEVLNVE